MAIPIQTLLRYFSPEAPPPAPTAPPPQGRGIATGGFSIIDDTGNQAKFGYHGFGPLKEKRGFIIHHTGPYPKDAGADFVEKIFGQRKFPAQYVIDRQGNIHRAVTEGQRGQHIRSGSKWTPLGKKLGLSNENTEGVEIMAADDSDVTPQQVAAASWLANQLGYRPDQIFGHGEINSHKMHNEGMTAVRAIRANGFSQPAQPQPTPQSPSRFSMPTVDGLLKAFLPNQANASTSPKSSDPLDFTDRYNTKLSPNEEQQFQKWAVANHKDKDAYDYDIRGAWRELQSGQMTAASNGHLGDKYKKPNHPTFSDQSIYHGRDGFIGGKWAESKDGSTSFAPSTTNLNFMPADKLQGYFNKYEQGNRLILPSARGLQAPTRPQQQAGGLHPNVGKAFNFYRSKGLTPHQAAGVVGSMMQESGPNLDPNAKNPSSGAYGIAQWLGTRKTGVLGVGGKGNLDAQLDYSWRELTGSERSALKSIQGAGSYSDTAKAHRKFYERPREDEARDDKRINYASQVYSTLGGNAAPAKTPPFYSAIEALTSYFTR